MPLEVFLWMAVVLFHGRAVCNVHQLHWGMQSLLLPLLHETKPERFQHYSALCQGWRHGTACTGSSQRLLLNV